MYIAQLKNRRCPRFLGEASTGNYRIEKRAIRPRLVLHKGVCKSQNNRNVCVKYVSIKNIINLCYHFIFFQEKVNKSHESCHLHRQKCGCQNVVVKSNHEDKQCNFSNISTIMNIFSTILFIFHLKLQS